jgi:hypothetical protein
LKILKCRFVQPRGWIRIQLEIQFTRVKAILFITLKTDITEAFQSRYTLPGRGGKIIVDITVNRQGRVISAEPQKTPGINDEQLYLYAKAAASRTVFNSDPNAPEPQRGTIHYTFVPQ